jgi:4-amino-4-deoxy-L-arabinose transferase-like glycosyltransferase
MSARRFALALALLSCLALAGAERARFSQWTTSDEPPHVAAAREWRYGPGMVSNFEHPVLMKVIAGSALREGRPDLEIDETRAARAPLPFVLAALVAATGLLGRALAGPAAGLAAAGLLAVEPTFRGHGTLVQSDVLVTLFLVAAALALEKGAARDRRWLAASGVLYGFAMAAKYSAFPFLAVFALVAVVRLLEARRAFTRRFLSSLSSVFLLIVLPALVTLALVQAFAYAGTSDEAFLEGLGSAFRGLPQERAALALARSFPKWIAGYGAGLLFVQGVAGPGERFNYFFGEVRGTGSVLYFPVALGIKLTAATVAGSLGALFSGAAALFRAGRLRGLLISRAWLPVALGGAYLAAACVSNVNIGVRHVLPAVPFLLVAAAAAACSLLEARPRALRAVLLAVVVLAAAESALRLGREISFGNLFVGGPSGVPPVLSDSNVDWGQEQGLVFERVRRGGLGTVAMATLLVDESSASRAGIAGLAMKADAPADTVFFSRFLWDLAAAAEKNTESYPKFAWLRGWLPPLRRGLEARATSIEPFGDAYLLMRLRPATAALPSPPGSTP